MTRRTDTHGQATPLPFPKSGITRESLVDGSFIAYVRDAVPRTNPDALVRSDAELAAAQAEFLRGHAEDEPLWVFGYGSLMWSPAIEYDDRRVGTAHGWSRRLNVWMLGGRGSKEAPALTLGLERGGETEGIAMLLPPDNARYELSLVWQREGFSDAYRPVWVEVDTTAGVIKAVTFASNPDSDAYAGDLSDDTVADVVATASGPMGSCREYLDQTLASIAKLGLDDPRLRHIQELAGKIGGSI